MRKLTPRQAALHIIDIEERCKRIARRNDDLLTVSKRLREENKRLKVENEAMLGALVKAYRSMTLFLRDSHTNEEVQEISNTFDAINAFTGNLETESTP